MKMHVARDANCAGPIARTIDGRDWSVREIETEISREQKPKLGEGKEIKLREKPAQLRKLEAIEFE